MTKLRYVAKLSEAAKRLLRMVEHITRKLPGTQETQRMMRFDTHAYRVRYGVPIFVTFTPDEAHNTVMLRLSRSRRGDPVVGEGGDPIARKLHGRCTPSMSTTPEDDVELTLDLKKLPAELLTYEERVAALARDSLASVDGFHVIVRLTLKHLFGMQICPTLSGLQQRRQLHTLPRYLRKQQHVRRWDIRPHRSFFHVHRSAEEWRSAACTLSAFHTMPAPAHTARRSVESHRAAPLARTGLLAIQNARVSPRVCRARSRAKEVASTRSRLARVS